MRKTGRRIAANRLCSAILAFLIALLWVALSGLYEYNRCNIWVGSVNATPVLLWTTGLALVPVLARRLNLRTVRGVALLYWCGLVVIEYIGYYLLDIRRVAGDPGMFGSEIIHIPLFAYPFYILAGPLFYLLVGRGRRGE